MQGVDPELNNSDTLRYYLKKDDLEMVKCLIEERDLYYSIKPFYELACDKKCTKVQKYLQGLIKQYSDQFYEAVKKVDLETINNLISGDQVQLYTHCYNPGQLCNDQVTLLFLVKEYCVDINSKACVSKFKLYIEQDREEFIW